MILEEVELQVLARHYEDSETDVGDDDKDQEHVDSGGFFLELASCCQELVCQEANCPHCKCLHLRNDSCQTRNLLYSVAELSYQPSSDKIFCMDRILTFLFKVPPEVRSAIY